MAKSLRGIGAGAYTVAISSSERECGFAVQDLLGHELYGPHGLAVGVRCYPAAEHADGARLARGQRRRIQRRRGREREIERVFAPHVTQVDPDFFVRRRNSWKRPDLVDLVDMSSEAARDYARLRRRFPTLSHLDVWLMESGEAADIRLVFDSVVNHVVRRGNFLHQGAPVAADVSDAGPVADAFADEFVAYLSEARGVAATVDADVIVSGMATARPADLRDAIVRAVQADPSALGRAETRAMVGAVAKLASGYSADLSRLCDSLPKGSSCALGEASTPDELMEGGLPDELYGLAEACISLRSCHMLQGVLSYAPGEDLAHNRVAQYECYHADLMTLKALLRRYVAGIDADECGCPEGLEEYRAFFGGPEAEGRAGYDKDALAREDARDHAHGYTAYDERVIDYDAFRDRVARLLADTGAEADPRYVDMMSRFESGRFLRRPNTRENAAVPYQLHAEVVSEVIDSQARFHPWLAEAKGHILEVLRGRIPYYVGPLSTDNAPKGPDGRGRFAWSVRLPGHEDARVTPWNYAEHVDLDATAEAFVRRMVGECSYLDGEEALPRHSPLYERFLFLDELSAVRVTDDGDASASLTAPERRAVFELGLRERSVTYAKVEALLRERFGHPSPHVSGARDPKGMSSRLEFQPWLERVLGRALSGPGDDCMAEDLALWSAVYEDRAMFRRAVRREYGHLLTAEQLDAVTRKRFGGWGRLSRTLLLSRLMSGPRGDLSVMDVLEGGNPWGRTPGRPCGLSQMLADDRLGLSEAVSARNAERRATAGPWSVDDMPGSPAMRRPVSQAMKVLADVARDAGGAPATVYLEVLREPKPGRRGKASKARRKMLEDALSAVREDLRAPLGVARVRKALDEVADDDLADDAVYLWFRQCGCCLYSGERIELPEVGGAGVVVDHILPRAWRPDGSLDNRALVLASEAAAKAGSLFVTPRIRERMASRWRMLRAAGLMSERRLSLLMRTDFTKSMASSALARSTTERSYSYRLLAGAIGQVWPETRVVCVKQAVASAVARRVGVRYALNAGPINSARRAVVASQVGRMEVSVLGDMLDDRIRIEKVRRLAAQANEDNARARGELDFVAGAFFRDEVDEATGEVRWLAREEVNRTLALAYHRGMTRTYMSSEEGGAFWKQTTYAPSDRSGKKALIPLKDGLDPQLYGGRTSQRYAYFVLFEARRRGRRRLRLEGVPVSVAGRIAGAGDEGLEGYVRSLAGAAGEDLVRIVRARLYKGQVVRWGGEAQCLRGLSVMAPARLFAPSLGLTSAICLAEAVGTGRAEPTSEVAEVLCGCWDELLATGARVSPDMAAAISGGVAMTPSELVRGARPDGVADATRSVAWAVREVARIFSGAPVSANLTPLGGKAFVGKVTRSLAKLASVEGSGLRIVDVSPAGMSVRESPVV